jgi:hypothetical protein
MPKKKLDFTQPMTRELITRIIDKEMKLADDPEGRALALNYMTQMVEQGYVVTQDLTQRYTIQETMDMTWAYMDGYNDAMKTLDLNMKKMMEKLNIPPGMSGGTLV